MIRYAVSRAELLALIERERPGWLGRAAARTAGFRQAGKFSDKSPIWSEIKGVYIRLQGGGKCAFCERKLESEAYGRIEFDVEHFRPKSKVRAWNVPKALADLGVVAAAPPPGAKGYHLLAYAPFNYLVSCKPCNSTLKSDYFPVAGAYDTNGENPAALKSKEKPLLIYPLGTIDDDPERLIRFHGVSPQPVAARRSHKRSRALATIAFFRLDDVVGRENLILERAHVIASLCGDLEVLADGGSAARVERARALAASRTSPYSPHTNCARSFQALFQSDRAAAEALANAAARFLASKSTA